MPSRTVGGWLEDASVSASTGRSRNLLRRVAADVAARVPVLVEVYRSVRNPRWALDLRRDLHETIRTTTFLRSLPNPQPGAPVALVALYRDNIYEAKLAFVLGTALRSRGMRPVVTIPSNHANRLRRYTSAFGLEEVLALDSLALERDDLAACDQAVEELLRSAESFESIKAWSFRGRNVGSHVLSTLIRVTFDGSPDLGLARHRQLLEPILRDVLLSTLRAERLMGDLTPAVMLVEEANYSINGPAVDVAVDHAVDVVQTVGIWREDALMSKRLTKANRRSDALSVAPETFARLAETPLSQEEDSALTHDFDVRYGGVWALSRQFQPDTSRRRPEEIVDELGLDATKRTAVIFAHVLWDASLFFGVDLFANYADWLVQTVGAAVGNDAVNWIVKAHPSNVFRAAHGDVGGESSEVALVREHFPNLPGHVHLLLPETRISTLSLYEFADYGVTVRGTPGLEIACFGKPAFTAGTGTYAGLGFTYDSATTDEFLGRLGSVQDYGALPEAMTARARRYAHTYFLRRPWFTKSFALRFEFAERGWHPTDRNVEITARSLDEIRRYGDLERFARWALEHDDADLLGEP